MRVRRPRHAGRNTARTTAIAGLFLLLAACTGTQQPPQPKPAAASGNPGDPTDLRGVCPATVVVQTQWTPHITVEGGMYHLLGANPAIDAGRKRVSAPLVVRDKDTGVTLELRAGGPAIGFTQSSAQLYTDPGITLGVLGGMDEGIQMSATQPTLAVMALLEIHPQIILWDPATYPTFNTIKDIGRTDTKVLYFGGNTYMEYLVGAGLLKRGQVDGSYDGSPSHFVAAGGKAAVAGYANAEPYIYEKDVPQWGKPVKYQLVYDAGYPNYGPPLVIRPADKQKLAPCLRKLIPIFQQAQVDVLAEPGPTIDLTLRLNQAYKVATQYTRPSSEFSVQQMKALKLAGNGPDDTVGNFDTARVQRLIDITRPIFAKQNKPVKDGLQPSDVVTNDFVDPKIGYRAG
ncbi:nitrate ABC transporter substrate-binding protein [Nonomuraea angiospora]|uniref:nitrate ABC transporter substrate-binding protein n=1 Tax=Nonomuraea angiospora TaxID=46172 RepID=UPI00379F7D02